MGGFRVSHRSHRRLSDFQNLVFVEIRQSCLPQSFIFLLTDNSFTSLYTINTGSNLVDLTHNASI